jgi:hypothetical protein
VTWAPRDRVVLAGHFSACLAALATISAKIGAMFLPPPHGTDRAQSLAARLGCAVGELQESGSRNKPALLGSVSASASILEEFGGKWDPTERVYAFANWPMLEAALQHMAEAREKSRLG